MQPSCSLTRKRSLTSSPHRIRHLSRLWDRSSYLLMLELVGRVVVENAMVLDSHTAPAMATLLQPGRRCPS